MKKMLFTLALVALPLFVLRAMAQETPTDGIFVNYEQMPEYPGGERQWKKDRDTYMETRLKELFPGAHPDSLATDEPKRRIIVQFTIDKKGEVRMPSLIRGLHPVLDKEALGYVIQLPRFKPGAFDGKPRDVKFTVPLFIHPYYLRLLERDGQVLTDTTVYEVVEKMPEYPGGIDKLMKDIRTSTANYWKKRYPKGKPKPIVIEDGVIGRVVVSFVINKNGQATDPVILRSVEKDLDKEAIRIIKSMPRWIPGEYKGKKVKVKFTLPVQF